MNIYMIVLLALHFPLALCCQLNGALKLTQTRRIACLAFDDCLDIALCLLQVNSLSRILQCSDYETNSIISWDLDTDAYRKYLRTADKCDLIPTDSDIYKNGFDQSFDTYFKLTPRGLLLRAIDGCEEDEVCLNDMPEIFRGCPLDDMQKFIDCLCCNLIQADDIENLNSYIWDYDFGVTEYSNSYKWSCYNRKCVPPSTASSSRRATQLEMENRDSSQDITETEHIGEENGNSAVNARGNSMRTFSLTATPIRGTSYSATKASSSRARTTINMSAKISGSAEVSDDMIATTITMSTPSSTDSNGSMSSKRSFQAFSIPVLATLMTGIILWA